MILLHLDHLNNRIREHIVRIITTVVIRVGQVDKSGGCGVGGGRGDRIVVKEPGCCCWMEGHVHRDAWTDGALWLWVVELR